MEGRIKLEWEMVSVFSNKSRPFDWWTPQMLEGLSRAAFSTRTWLWQLLDVASGSSLCPGLSALKECTKHFLGFHCPVVYSYKSPRFHLASLASLRGPVTTNTRGDGPQALAFGLTPPLHHPWMHTSPPPPPGPWCAWHRNPSRWGEGALTLVWKVSVTARPPTAADQY